MRKGLIDVSVYYMCVCVCVCVRACVHVCAFCVILLEAEVRPQHTLHI